MSVAEEKKAPEVQVEKEDAKPGEASKHEVTLDDALKLAQAHHRSGNLMIAERTYNDILRAVPEHYPTTFYLAALLFQRGNLEESIKYGVLATEADPDNASVWSNYAVTLSASDKNEEALEAFDKAIAIDPELFEAYSNKSYSLWKLARYEEAEEMAAQATMLNPDSADAFINLGIALAAQNKLDEAEEVWEQVVALDPNNAKAYSNWCNALREQGRFEEAMAKGEKAIELDGNDAEAYNNLACVYKEYGQQEEALVFFRKATDITPDYYKAHNNMAMLLTEMERYAEAKTAARYAISFKKDFADAYSILSLAHSGLGEYDEARKASDMAINLEPDEPFHYLTLADVMIAIDRFDEAEAVLHKALELNPTEARTLIKVSEVRRNLDMLDEAVEAIDQAIENHMETPNLLIQKARILEMANKVEEALKSANRATEIAPKHPYAILTKADLLLTINRKDEAKEVLEAGREHVEGFPGFYYALGSYKKFTEDDADFKRMLGLFEKEEDMGLDARATLNFAAFKAYEDIGDYEKAFEHLKKANDCNKEAHVFNDENMAWAFDRKKKMFSPAVIKQYEGRGFKSDVPVFICGMPRSGTTLTEQIISSHPDIYGAGELYDLSSVIREVGPVTPENAEDMGKAYVEKIKARDVTGNAKRVTDKMPGNYNNIGLILSILPNAKIIHCRRNPIDNCLSCYKQNFATGQYWSYDLDYLAKQYCLYEDLMQYWRDTLPEGSFLEVDYEETVGNFEEQARKLIDFVDMEWNDACLEPHKQKRAVLTASKDQVIRPIYKSSVEAWRRYEKQLAPLIEGLEPVLKKRGIDV